MSSIILPFIAGGDLSSLQNCAVRTNGANSEKLATAYIAPVAKIVHVTPNAGVSSAGYTIAIKMTGGDYAGNTYFAYGTGTANTVADAVDQLVTAVNGAMPANTVAATDGTTHLILTGEVAGDDFEIVQLSSDAPTFAPTITVDTANVASQPDTVGILQDAPTADGKRASVCVAGKCLAKLGGAVEPMDQLMVGADGKLVLCAPGRHVIGQFLGYVDNGAHGDGEADQLAEVLIYDRKTIMQPNEQG